MNGQTGKFYFSIHEKFLNLQHSSQTWLSITVIYQDSNTPTRSCRNSDSA